ncbi:uncharacterized protein FOBCDRAFT_203979 [Fusarium oxysporum Fo47]|uniref:Uncharacterized protein n=1 Tax=Fusarium oxysporum Fo47 TaxID=660027 RepID=W9J8V4_FUSOX|nr:uncharacterized protein FOBCDRAFT_203979 [Fusarium oxysporum Fo47]EWZ28472.1 hypothetical protein FOZG_17865 [Fusarium oxysporum Fo47]QKD56931.2 hypothetical protein FOBCDRAFT_203979 [Fusarium oxysporum Fo47]
MRFSLCFPIGLAANSVVASQCKPRTSSDSSTASIESATSTIATARSTEIDMTTTSSVHLSTSTVTSTSEDDTTTDSISSELSVSTTMSATTTTSDSDVEPIATFGILASGSQVDGKYLTGRLAFSIDPITNYVRESGGNVLCVGYGSDRVPNFVLLCSLVSLNLTKYSFITCEQTPDRRLESSAQAGECTGRPFQTCAPIPGATFSQFQTFLGRDDGIFLAMTSASNPPTGNTFQAVDFEITALQS